MKTFIIYDLDTGLPIAVGDAVKAEWARQMVADRDKILSENLFAEEVDLRFDVTSLAFCNKAQIEKNSKPNPRIVRRSTLPYKITAEAIDHNAQVMKDAELYSAAVKKIFENGGVIPTLDEWLKDDKSKKIG